VTHRQRATAQTYVLITSDSAYCMMSEKRTLRMGYESRHCLLWIAKAKPAFAQISKGRMSSRLQSRALLDLKDKALRKKRDSQ